MLIRLGIALYMIIKKTECWPNWIWNVNPNMWSSLTNMHCDIIPPHMGSSCYQHSQDGLPYVL